MPNKHDMIEEITIVYSYPKMPNKHNMIVEVLCDGPTGPEARNHQQTIETYYREATERGLDFFEALRLARVTWVKEFLND